MMKFLFFYGQKVFDDVPILLNYSFDEEDDVFFFFFHVLGVTDNILLRNANFHAISQEDQSEIAFWFMWMFLDLGKLTL